MNCANCGKELDMYDVGLTKKLINRGAVTFYCKSCLAKRFNVTEELLDEKIVQFRRMGCMLFPPLDEDK